MEVYKFEKINPQPFCKRLKGGHRFEVQPDQVEYKHWLDIWIFYVEGVAVCMRTPHSPEIVGIERLAKGWHWKMKEKGK